MSARPPTLLHQSDLHTLACLSPLIQTLLLFPAISTYTRQSDTLTLAILFPNIDPVEHSSMHVNNLPPTGSHVAPHAHPSLVESGPACNPTQRLEDLALSLPLQVDLEGLAASGQNDVHSMYHPRVRRSVSASQAMEHVDIVTCWKGLSHPQACELAFWEHAFRDCIRLQIEGFLRTLIASQVGQDQRPADDFLLLFDINERLANAGSHAVKIDSNALIDSMMDLFYHEAPFRPGGSFDWGISSENLPRFLCNLVCTQDCFVQGADGPMILIDQIAHDYGHPIFNITAKLAWSAPRVRFDNVPSCVKPEEEYRITPVFVEPASLFDASTCEPYPDRFHYTVTRSNSVARWDADARCFRMSPLGSITEVSG